MSDQTLHVATVRRSTPGSRAFSTVLAPLIALFGLWLVVRPYAGISGDAILYVGKVLAQLDPAGVGRDIVFSHDRQMHFTLFPPLMTGAIRGLGLAHGAESVAFAAVVVWFLAIAVLALHLAEGRRRWLILSFIFLAPSYYANGFHFGEALAVPRPFAEALVLLGCAALLRQKFWLAGALMLGAALLHPIMALPGFGMLFLSMLERDRRWLWLALGLLPLLSLAAAMHLSLLGRGFATIDAQWWAILQQGNFNIIPLLWNPFAYAQLLTQVATLIVAIMSLERRYKSFFLHVLIVACSGFVLAVLFGDLIHDELVVQAQLWRALWLAAVLAPAALGLLVVEARTKAPAAWIVPALLATAWLPTSGLAKVLMCGCALLLDAMPVDKLAKIPPHYAQWAVRLLLLFGIVNLLANDVRHIAMYHIAFERWHIVSLKLNMFGWFAGLLLFFMITAPNSRKFGEFGLVAAACCALLGLYAWDGRAAFRKQVDSGRPVAPFSAIIANRPGPVYWVGGKNEAWFWLRRANWYSNVQSWPIVFSRRQALQWQNHAERVVKFGFESAASLRPADMSLRKVARRHLSAAGVAAFCAAPDAPSWIVWQVAASDAMLAAGVTPKALWRVPTGSAPEPGQNSAAHARAGRTFALMACHASAS